MGSTSKMGQSLLAEVSETTMPQCGGQSSDGKGARSRWQPLKRVEVATSIAPDDHVLGVKILHRNAKGVKFNRTVIIDGEMANGNKVFNERWGHNDII